ncbi:MAG: flagellar basal-body MS-ring/collar protein FliF [Pseudomonadota bacterium]
MAAGNIFSQLKALWSQLSAGRQITFLTVVGAASAVFVFLMLWAAEPEYGLLFSDLTMEDSGAIYEKLKEQKIPVKLASNGSAILVPREQVNTLRLEFAAKGMPQSSTVGFELFDNTRLGMTEFMQNVNYQRAIQGEITRTINQFSEVESSRVHIVLPQKALFEKDEEPATASVILKMRPGQRLGQPQVQGIVHLVASSVSGLSKEQVIVVDSKGNILAGNKDASGIGRLSSDQLAFQQQIERNMEERVRSMLEKALGRDSAIVRVSAEVDFKQREKTEERYLPENQVVRSEKLLSHISNGQEKSAQGVPGTGSNLTERKNGGSTTTATGFQKEDRTVNYEVGRVTNHVVEPTGQIVRISVAALIDGTYRRIADPANDGQFQMKYLPRSETEMAKLESIIKSAVNFSASRGDIIEVANIPFRSEEDPAETPTEQLGWVDTLKQYEEVFRYGFIFLSLLFGFLFVVRPLVRWVTTSTAGDVELLKQLPMTVGELEQGYRAPGGGMGFKDQALSLLTQGHDSGMAVMNNWVEDK